MFMWLRRLIDFKILPVIVKGFCCEGMGLPGGEEEGTWEKNPFQGSADDFFIIIIKKN